MPKLVSTVSTVVVRDGKRIPVTAGKPFDFTSEEVEQIKRVMPSALRKPVNEDPTPTDETAPEGEAGATATDDPKTSAKTAKKKAAQKNATSEAATKPAEAAPKSTKAAPKDDGTEDADDADEDDGEDDDL